MFPNSKNEIYDKKNIHMEMGIAIHDAFLDIHNENTAIFFFPIKNIRFLL